MQRGARAVGLLRCVASKLLLPNLVHNLLDELVRFPPAKWLAVVILHELVGIEGNPSFLAEHFGWVFVGDDGHDITVTLLQGIW